MNDQLLRDKVVLITGGAGLLGQEFVLSVVEHGGTAIIADVNLETAKQIAERIKIESGLQTVHAICVDINSKSSLIEAIESLDRDFGRIDALVNNAYPRNKNYGRHFYDVEYSDFCENVNINLGGYFLASQQLSKYFKVQGYGNIINVSSIYGVVAPQFEIYNQTEMTVPVEYAAIKSGLLHLTKYMSKYFKDMDIRVNAISPGGIFDNQPDAFIKAYREKCLNKGMLNKEDISGTLIYLLSDLSRYVNGQNIIVDDGFSI